MISYIIYNNLDLLLLIPLSIGLLFSLYMGMKENKNNLDHDLIHGYEIEHTEKKENDYNKRV